MSPQQLSILVADDDLGDRKQIRRAFVGGNFDCKLTEAEDMEQALAACDQQLFDCVLLDYRMPGLDGLEGVSELNKKNIPFCRLLW